MRGKYERGGAQHDPQGALHDPSLHDCGTATYTGHGNVSNYRRDVTTMTSQLVYNRFSEHLYRLLDSSGHSFIVICLCRGVVASVVTGLVQAD